MRLFVVIPRVRIMQCTRAPCFHKKSATLSATLRPTPDYRLRIAISSENVEQFTKWNSCVLLKKKKEIYSDWDVRYSFTFCNFFHKRNITVRTQHVIAFRILSFVFRVYIMLAQSLMKTIEFTVLPWMLVFEWMARITVEGIALNVQQMCYTYFAERSRTGLMNTQAAIPYFASA